MTTRPVLDLTGTPYARDEFMAAQDVLAKVAVDDAELVRLANAMVGIARATGLTLIAAAVAITWLREIDAKPYTTMATPQPSPKQPHDHLPPKGASQ